MTQTNTMGTQLASSIYNYISNQYANVVKACAKNVDSETLEMEPMQIVGNPNILEVAKSNGADEIVMVDEGEGFSANESGLAAVYNFEPMNITGKVGDVTEYTFENPTVIQIETKSNTMTGINRFAARVNGASSMR